MKNCFLVDLKDIQPSQLYLNKDKLDNVLSRFKSSNYDSYEAIPIIQLDNKLVFTDGHTRAYAAFLQGVKKIKVYWDDDTCFTNDLCIKAYKICVRWCESEGVLSIYDLKGRVISHKDYKELWLNKCGKMHDIINLNNFKY
jgi:hypothetical protein